MTSSVESVKNNIVQHKSQQDLVNTHISNTKQGVADVHVCQPHLGSDWTGPSYHLSSVI